MIPTADAAPVHATERAGVLDALRGFAVLGILLANMQHFSGWYFLTADARAGLGAVRASGAVEFAIAWFVDGKFYSLFSLLFGIGFAVMLLRAEQDGRDFRAIYRRRLGILLGIGLVHAWLIWYGDILFLYALLGFALLGLHRKSDATLAAWVVLLFALPIVQYLLVFVAFGGPASPLADSGAQDAFVAEAVRVMRTGSWSEVTATNVRILLFGRYPDLLFTGRPFKVLATFIIGLWIGRSGIWAELHAHAPLLRRTAVWGLGIGLPLNLGLALLMQTNAYYELQPWGLVHSVVYGVGVPLLALGYAAAFALLWQRAAARRVIALFQPVGRMALTNYVAHSVIGGVIFYGYGFGLLGSVNLATATVLALLIFAGQAAVCTLWLRRCRYGPLEWVWRSLTLGRRQPMRLPAPAGAEGQLHSRFS